MVESGIGIERWPAGVDVPDEARLRERMAAEGLTPYRWSNAPGDVYGAHTHPYHKVIYVAHGSITFGVPGRQIELHAGDRLDLPAGTRHDAVVGAEGVVCLEAPPTPN